MGLECYENRNRRDYIKEDYEKENDITGIPPVPEPISDALYNSIARIEFEKKHSTGFFMKLDIKEKRHNFFITCNHSITQENVDSKIDIKIYYGKANKEKNISIKLDKNERNIKCFEKLDATLIEILEADKIDENKYLSPDLNYKGGYDQYKDSNIYSAGYPNEENFNRKRHTTSGKIEKINDFNIYHNCNTKPGSSGSPLIDCKMHVIGLHKGFSIKKKLNTGTFIGEIIDELNKDEEDERLTLKENKTKEKKDKKINKKKEKEEEKKLYNNINNIEEPKKNIEDINTLTQPFNQEEFPNIFQNLADSMLKMVGMEGINPQLIGEIYQNPLMINYIKQLYSNPKLVEGISNLPQIQQMKEKNPLVKFTFENPELIKESLTPENMNFISKIFAGTANNNANDGNSRINMNKENYIKKMNDDGEKYKEYLIKLKEMGFTNKNLNLDLLNNCEGDFEKTLDLLIQLKE